MRKLTFLWLAMALVAATPTLTQAQYQWTSARPDGHAPIGVMGEHMHSKGEFMLAYRFMRMLMAGNRTGTTQVDTRAVHENFMVAPVDMTMMMHMAGAMYGPSDRVTLMGMFSWVDKGMSLLTRPGRSLAPTSAGIGDAKVGALVGLKQTGAWRVHLNATASLPTGSIEQVGPNPMSMGKDVQMPYPMQLGSGTWDLMPGLTVLGMTENVSWGMQAIRTLRLGENSRGYKLGGRTQATAWLGYKLSDYVSLAARVLADSWGNYSGQDAAYMNQKMVPTVRADLRGGTRLDVPVGFNLYIRNGALKGHRVAAEWHIPVYQDLNGPQLETDWILTLGWQLAFAPPGHDH